MVKSGISEENLRKLFTHAQIGEKEQDMVRNLSFLGVNTISDVSQSHLHIFMTKFHLYHDQVPSLILIKQ